MKVIDLINKINNNEEAPKKIKLDNVIFEFDKDKEEYIHKLDDWRSETILFKAMNENTYFIQDLLKIEVEVIQENKEIEELNKISYDEFKYSDNKHRFDLTTIEYDKINELVRAVNKINKEREEKVKNG